MVDHINGVGNVQREKNFTISEKISYLTGLLDLGYWIFPLHDLTFPGGVPHCGCHLGTRCPGPGKHPLVKWSQPLDPKTQFTRELIASVVKHFPDRGWGLHVGLSNLAILDVDPRHGGDATLAGLKQSIAMVLDEGSVITGGDGKHHYRQAPVGTDPIKGFKGPNGHTSTNISLGQGLEFFTGQHYVVLPYSPHASGNWYRMGEEPRIMPVPAELLAHINEMEVFRVKEKHDQKMGQATGSSADEKRRTEHHQAKESEIRASRWLEAREPAIQGQGGRRHTAATASALVIDFGLQLDVAMRLLVAWNAANLPPWEVDQLRAILDWASGRPGERGHKLRTGQVRARLGREEDLAWMKDVGLDLISDEWITHLDPGGGSRITPRPRQPILAQEELDGIRGGSGTADARCVNGRGETEPPTDPPQPEPPAEGDDLADTPVLVPSDEPPAEEGGHYHVALGPECTCSFLVLLHQASTRRLRIVRLPGRRWDCPSCSPRRREHYRATVRHHLADWAEQTQGLDAPNLWIATVPAAIWRRCASSMRLRHAQFVRLDTTAVGAIHGESFLVVSTEATRHVHWEPIMPRQATETLVRAIDALSCGLCVRVWWSSRLWQLLPDRPPKDPEWDRIGRLRSSWRAVKDVLDYWEIKTTRIRGAGRFWAWSGYQCQYPDGMWDALQQDLGDGAPGTKIAMEMGIDPENPPKGFDGADLLNPWT